MKHRQERMPDPNFEARAVYLGENPVTKLRCAREVMGMPHPKDPVLKGTPLAKVRYGKLFAYMYRRFGLPNHMGGYTKELSGGWFLTTPSTGLYLLVRPSVDSPAFSFDPVVTKDQVRMGRMGRGEALSDELARSYSLALLDLLRPVPVRDLHINAMGKVPRGDPLLEGDRFAVRPESDSALAAPPGLTDNWTGLIDLARRLGGGNTEKGFAELIGAGKLALAGSRNKAA